MLRLSGECSAARWFARRTTEKGSECDNDQARAVSLERYRTDGHLEMPTTQSWLGRRSDREHCKRLGFDSAGCPGRSLRRAWLISKPSSHGLREAGRDASKSA